MAPAVGEVFTVAYPFIRGTWEEVVSDDEGWSRTELPTWRPGVRVEQYHMGSEDVADGVGAQILTVHGVYKPEGRYQARVFYTRRWRDPDGREFGKGDLKIKGVVAFRAIANGYRFPFQVVSGAADRAKAVK